MRKLLPLAAAAAMIAAAPAVAQQTGGGLVVVNVSNVANNIARDLDINVSNVPVTVQVPVAVAAAVCNVDVNVLARQGRGGETRECTAESTSDALNKVVQRQMTKQ